MKDRWLKKDLCWGCKPSYFNSGREQVLTWPVMWLAISLALWGEELFPWTQATLLAASPIHESQREVALRLQLA